MRRLAALLAAVGVGCASAPKGSEQSPIFRLSLPTKADHYAWNETGFRLQLGYGLGRQFAIEALPEFTTHAMIVRGGVRLSEDWSLFGHLRYEVAVGDASGLRYAGTIEPTYHITDGFTMSLGLGVGGLIVSVDEPTRGQRDRSGPPRTRIESTPPLNECTGTGVVATARLEYSFVLGSLGATGPAIWTDVQYTACTAEVAGVNPETGGPSKVKQYWHHHSGAVGWFFSWR